MRHGMVVCAAGVLLAGCYLSHPDLAPRPRDGGPDPFDGFVPRFDSDVPFDGSRPDGDIPPFDGSRPDSDVPFDGSRPDAMLPDAMLPDASRPDSGPRDSGPPSPALRMARTTYLEVEDSPVFDTVSNHCFELWVRTRETGDADYCQKGDSIARHLFAGQRDGRLVMGWDVFPEPYYVGGPAMPIGVWTHLALVVVADAGGRHTAEAYMNGMLVDTRTGVPDLLRAFNDVEIICGNADFDVDEIRVWRVQRTGAQIRANMNMRLSGGIPSTLR